MLASSYANAGAFLRKAQDFLESREVINSLILGISLRLKALGESNPNHFATVVDGADIVAAAAMTPPHRVIVTSIRDGEDIELLAQFMLGQNWKVPGVVGLNSTALAFAETWSKLVGCTYRIKMHERFYQLKQVTHPTVPGKLRLAVPAEAEEVTNWFYAFEKEAVGDPPPLEVVRENINMRIAYGDVQVWDVDGKPVSMALRVRPTRHTVSVGGVYTPPEYRGRGYASACVAAVSQSCLDLGFESCVLFTDLANPTSNSIYQKIGYHPVADFDEYLFDPI